VLGRRLVILVAVLMGLTALAASVAPPPDRPRRGASSPSPSPTPDPSTAPTGAPREVALVLDQGVEPPVVHAVSGDSIQLDVKAETVDSVVIDGLDAVAAVAPDSPAHFELFADAPGRYPIRLLDGGVTLGRLVISSGR
jgi:hypothetical protein